MNWKNPFRLKDTPDGPWYEVLRPDGPGMLEFTSDEFHTLVAVHDVDGVSDVVGYEPGHASGSTVAKLPGLWAPPIGTVIQVGEPNRDVIVTDVRYQVDPGGFAAIVFVTDSDRESSQSS